MFGARDLWWLLRARLRPALIPHDLIEAQANALGRQIGAEALIVAIRYEGLDGVPLTDYRRGIARRIRQGCSGGRGEGAQERRREGRFAVKLSMIKPEALRFKADRRTDARSSVSPRDN